jgi:hypothetical protein
MNREKRFFPNKSDWIIKKKEDETENNDRVDLP